MTLGHMSTARVRGPLTFTINRLTTTASCAMVQVVGMRAGVTVIQSILANGINTATFVLMTFQVVKTFIILAPRSNAVHWLGAFLSGALLKLVSVWAGISIVGSSHRHLVQSALLVLVGIFIVSALAVLIPSTHAIHWLSALLSGALLKLVSV